ncbi:unnamed protein product, partial [Pylaiella littoralis]
AHDQHRSGNGDIECDVAAAAAGGTSNNTARTVRPSKQGVAVKTPTSSEATKESTVVQASSRTGVSKQASGGASEKETP